MSLSLVVVIFIFNLLYPEGVSSKQSDVGGVISLHYFEFFVGLIPFLTIVSIFCFYKFKRKMSILGVIGILISTSAIIFCIFNIIFFYEFIDEKGGRGTMCIAGLVLFSVLLTIVFNIFMLGLLRNEYKNFKMKRE